jgi:hypothetical protein
MARPRQTEGQGRPVGEVPRAADRARAQGPQERGSGMNMLQRNDVDRLYRRAVRALPETIGSRRANHTQPSPTGEAPNGVRWVKHSTLVGVAVGIGVILAFIHMRHEKEQWRNSSYRRRLAERASRF